MHHLPHLNYQLLIYTTKKKNNSETQEKIYIQGYWRLRIIFSTGIWTQIPLKLPTVHLSVVEYRFAIHQQSFLNILVTSMIHPVLKQIWWTSPWRGLSPSRSTEGAQTTRSGWVLHFRQTPRPLLHLLPLLPPQQQSSTKGKAWRPPQRWKQVPAWFPLSNLKSHI